MVELQLAFMLGSQAEEPHSSHPIITQLQSYQLFAYKHAVEVRSSRIRFTQLPHLSYTMPSSASQVSTSTTTSSTLQTRDWRDLSQCRSLRHQHESLQNIITNPKPSLASSMSPPTPKLEAHDKNTAIQDIPALNIGTGHHD